MTESLQLLLHCFSRRARGVAAAGSASAALRRRSLMAPPLDRAALRSMKGGSR